MWLSVEGRTEVLKVLSLDRILANTKFNDRNIMDESEDGKLFSIVLPDENSSIRLLEVICGTGRRVVILVPQVRSVEEAQAWIQRSKTWIKPEVRT
jgi:hypothetical protein